MTRALRVSFERIEHMMSIADQTGTGHPAK